MTQDKADIWSSFQAHDLYDHTAGVGHFTEPASKHEVPTSVVKHDSF